MNNITVNTLANQNQIVFLNTHSANRVWIA
jgi:hypothetical protein